MTNTKLNALRTALEADKVISEDAREIILDTIEDYADSETTPRDLLDALEDGEYLALLFKGEPEVDEETERRHQAIVEEAYSFIEEFAE